MHRNSGALGGGGADLLDRGESWSLEQEGRQHLPLCVTALPVLTISVAASHDVSADAPSRFGVCWAGIRLSNHARRRIGGLLWPPPTWARLEAWIRTHAWWCSTKDQTSCRSPIVRAICRASTAEYSARVVYLAPRSPRIGWQVGLTRDVSLAKDNMMWSGS